MSITAKMKEMGLSPEELGFDPDELREKYHEEREKRLRPEGADQYIAAEGQFKYYVEDPYIEEVIEREPVSDYSDIILIGGGFGALITGARLREAGVRNIRIVDKAAEFGGAWYWNRYPNCGCDTEAYIYLPLLEEVGYIPSAKFVGQPEIQQHCINIARKFNLYDDVFFQTAVTELEWDESGNQWIVHTNRGDAMRARYVVAANGPLNQPKLPGIPGIADYKGHTFHTSRWDYGYTGGSQSEKLDKLGDKRIAIIGTGATAIQAIPPLAESAKELYVFQRTPSGVDRRNDRPTDPEWAASLKPGWHKERVENFTKVTTGGDWEVDLVNDGWTDIWRERREFSRRARELNLSRAEKREIAEIADFRKMERIRHRVDEIVRDPKVAAALKPYYHHQCKRPCLHDHYLEVYNRDNVHLVDTEGKGVERITENGVVAGGREYKVDCIIFSTGYEFATDYTHRCGFDVVGVDGEHISEHWKNGMRTQFGICSHGFPNYFIIHWQQAGFSLNFAHTITEQAGHIAHILNRCLKEHIVRLELTQEGEDDWVNELVATTKFNRHFLESCTPGIFNNEGKLDKAAILNFTYGPGPMAYYKKLAEWRESGDMPGFDIKKE